MLSCDECGTVFKTLGTPAGRVKQGGNGKTFTVRKDCRAYACRGQPKYPHVYNCHKPRSTLVEAIEERVWEIVAQTLLDPALIKSVTTAHIGDSQRLAGVPEVCRKLGVAARTYYRWRKACGGLRREQAKRLWKLEHESLRPTRCSV